MKPVKLGVRSLDTRLAAQYRGVAAVPDKGIRPQTKEQDSAFASSKTKPVGGTDDDKASSFQLAGVVASAFAFL